MNDPKLWIMAGGLVLTGLGVAASLLVLAVRIGRLLQSHDAMRGDLATVQSDLHVHAKDLSDVKTEVAVLKRLQGIS